MSDQRPETTPTPWSVGRTLKTPQTKRWTAAEIERNDRIEATRIFANFHDSDQGRGRIPIAELYSGHCGLDGAASNARLIVRAVNNHAALVEALRDLVQAADRVGDWGVDTRMSRALDKVDAALRAATEGETT